VSFNNISAVEHAKNQEYVHRVNVDKGWYDKPLLFLEAMALLITEIVEVSDAFWAEGLDGGWSAPPQMSSELADCYIRLVDDASRTFMDLGVQVDLYKESYQRREDGASFDSKCMVLIRRVRDAIESYRTHGLHPNGKLTVDTRKKLAFFFLQLQDFCDDLGVDLMKAFEAKMRVNESRPYRHGDKHA